VQVAAVVIHGAGASDGLVPAEIELVSALEPLSFCLWQLSCNPLLKASFFGRFRHYLALGAGTARYPKTAYLQYRTLYSSTLDSGMCLLAVPYIAPHAMPSPREQTLPWLLVPFPVGPHLSRRMARRMKEIRASRVVRLTPRMTTDIHQLRVCRNAAAHCRHPLTASPDV
jgi:hypothetical protein